MLEKITFQTENKAHLIDFVAVRTCVTGPTVQLSIKIFLTLHQQKIICRLQLYYDFMLGRFYENTIVIYFCFLSYVLKQKRIVTRCYVKRIVWPVRIKRVMRQKVSTLVTLSQRRRWYFLWFSKGFGEHQRGSDRVIMVTAVEFSHLDDPSKIQIVFGQFRRYVGLTPTVSKTFRHSEDNTLD